MENEKMQSLKFHGPFHFDDIDKTTGKIKVEKNSQNAPGLDQPGIYIWGFMYEFDGKSLRNPYDFNKIAKVYDGNNMQFIPYYVGKSTSNIFKDRLNKHHDVRNTQKIGSDADKYIRLSYKYLTEFFRDEDFPINTSSNTQHRGIYNIICECSPNYTQMKNSKVGYFNSPSILKNIYPELIPIPYKDNYPITLQNKSDGTPIIEDALAAIINSEYLNNFWFCYAIPKKEDSVYLKNFETLTFYSLKGKTISRTGSVPKEKLAEITFDTDIRIFKTERPSKKFPGY